MSRKELARKVWPSKDKDNPRSADTTTARIKQYETPIRDEYGRFTDVMLPAPRTLRRISEALEISWLSTFASAGYYREVLIALAALIDLGLRWLDADRAFEREDARLSFRSAGVTELGGKVVWDAMREPRYADRYIEGAITQLHLPQRKTIMPAGQETPEFMQRYFAWEDAQGEEQWAYVVPKPMAAAILITASGFPRRGDVWKAGVDMYAVHMLEAVTPLVDYALQGQKVSLTSSIGRADRALSDIRLPIDSRRVVAAEHMIAWADGISQSYTHYARLASMAYFGVAGISANKLSPEFYFPKLREAQLPDVQAFRHIQHLE